jgi:carboxypeptidase Taq
VSQAVYEQLCEHTRRTAILESISSLLGWDERTHMPPAAGAYRAEQATFLAGEIHKRRTAPELGDWLTELKDSPLTADPHGPSGTTIRELHRAYTKRSKLPRRLVEELARAVSLGEQAWAEARRENDFPKFLPHLTHLVELKREEAQAYGYTDSIYDPLLDDYEPDATTDEIRRVFAAFRDELVPLVQAITRSARQPNRAILRRTFPRSAQESFGRMAAERIGFDFRAGALDVTTHPFCSMPGPRDIRITTRYDENYFSTAFFGILHEAGHGLYDQGLPADFFGLPPGQAISLGIHESQSLMWENFVGRGRPFWEWCFPRAQAAFPEALGDVALDGFYFAANDVRPSLIRIDADEATYSLHIFIRFELEQALMTGDLNVADVRAAWNDKYREYLGIVPDTDADGCLQDVHWSAGLFGYFPTYALGKLYAAQFFATAEEQIGPLDEQFASGDFAPLLQWLRENIHLQGQRYTAGELVQRVTGRPLSHEPLMAYLRTKFGPLYGV